MEIEEVIKLSEGKRGKKYISLEWEVTDDVTVEHEEWLVILGQDVSGQGEGTRGAQRLLLVGKGDGDPEPREENILNVADNNNNVMSELWL